MLATDYAAYYKIAPQGKGESDFDFRSRVSGILRDRGQIIEAHEAYADKFFDESDDVMTGVMGAVAQAFHGTDYGSRGVRQIGDDFAVGTLVKNPKPKVDPMMALMAVMLFG
jgi:hypothetical protein